MILGSGFKRQCHGVATKSKKAGRQQEQGLFCLERTQAMLHCSLSALANVPALFNLISLSGHRDPHSQKREDRSTLHLANRPSKLCKKHESVQRANPAINGLQAAKREILRFTFPPWSQLSAVQCKHHHVVTSEQQREGLPAAAGAAGFAPSVPHALTREGLAITTQAQNASKYFLLERDNLLQSSQATAELWQEGVRFIHHVLESKQALQETLVMNYRALSRDSSADNMKNVLNKYQRLKQSASASSKTQRPFLSYTEIKPENQNRKLKIK